MFIGGCAGRFGGETALVAVIPGSTMVFSGNRMVYEFGPDQAKPLALGGGFADVAIPLAGTVGLPNPVIVLQVLTVAAAFASRGTRWGLHLFAIGGNEGRRC